MLGFLNVLYILQFFLITCFYVLLVTPGLISFLIIFRKYTLPDAFKYNNRFYGWFATRFSWPMLKVFWRGLDKIPKDKSFVLISNHPSALDIFFTASLPVPALNIYVRNWVFKLPFFNLFMKLANYINADANEPTDLVVKKLQSDKEKKYRICYLVYPEGHRSLDGAVHRFYGGAFHLAAQLDIPVVASFINGNFDFFQYKFPFFKPKKVIISIFDVIYPSQFAEENRPLELRKYVRKLYEDFSRNEK